MVRRAEDVGVSIPDPMILARGLSRITKKLVSAHPELHFRLQLVRSSLLLDSIPTHEFITKYYSEHVLAELEQLGHRTKMKEAIGGGREAPKLKKFEDAQGSSKKEGNERKQFGEKEKERGKRRFFLTDQGCRRGKNCSYSHQDLKDDCRRWSHRSHGHNLLST